MSNGSGNDPTEPEDHTQDHSFGAANTLLLVALLMICILAGFLLQEKRFKYLPESGASMLIGMIAGGIVRLTVASDTELDLLKFNPLLFFFLLLPPIIFEAGYTLKKKRFFSNIITISLYAVIGTFISTFVVGLSTFVFAKIGIIGIDSESPLQSLLFGSLISSVDPVATLAILGSAEANCDPLLYSLVFGESVLNDAVAIVLFHVMNSYASDEKSFQGSDIFKVFLKFFGMTFASILIGVLTGLICSFVFRNTAIHKYHAYEIQLLFLFSFGCFAFAELVSMSGVVALFFCALTLAHYNFYNLSVQTQISSVFVFEGLAKTSETVIFAYMGLSLFTSRATWSIIFIVIGTGLCVLGRAANIFPMTWLANKCRTEKINGKMQLFMFCSGLRGAVSYALAQQLSPQTGTALGVEIIQTTTLGIIILSTFVLGGTTPIVLERLGLKGTSTSDSNGASAALREDFASYHEMPRNPVDPIDSEEFVDTTRYENLRRRAHNKWRSFDSQYMKPWFGGKGKHQRNRISPALFSAIQEGDTESLLLNETDDRSDISSVYANGGGNAHHHHHGHENGLDSSVVRNESLSRSNPFGSDDVDDNDDDDRMNNVDDDLNSEDGIMQQELRNIQGSSSPSSSPNIAELPSRPNPSSVYIPPEM